MSWKLSREVLRYEDNIVGGACQASIPSITVFLFQSVGALDGKLLWWIQAEGPRGKNHYSTPACINTCRFTHVHTHWWAYIVIYCSKIHSQTVWRYTCACKHASIQVQNTYTHSYTSRESDLLHWETPSVTHFLLDHFQISSMRYLKTYRLCYGPVKVSIQCCVWQ